MIATHHLAYAGVLLVFLAGAAIVAISAFLFLGTAWLTATGVRFIKRRTSRKLPAVEPALPMEEALRQAAAGKAAHQQEQAANLQALPGSDGKTASGISFSRVNHMCGRLMPGSLRQVPRMKSEGPARGAKT